MEIVDTFLCPFILRQYSYSVFGRRTAVFKFPPIKIEYVEMLTFDWLKIKMGGKLLYGGKLMFYVTCKYFGRNILVKIERWSCENMQISEN